MVQNKKYFNISDEIKKRYEKWDPRLCRLKMLKFVGKVVLFERSEFTTFPLSKFKHFQETRQNRGRLSFCLLFLWRSKEKVSRQRRNPFLPQAKKSTVAHRAKPDSN
ncbi:hypothetical protein [Lonepinella sp. MS14437]|uniref:hypothetical protein n=1 Tax=Lonepinella sp. MS14437 TaxID=3003620 RepID=UPI0036D9361A